MYIMSTILVLLVNFPKSKSSTPSKEDSPLFFFSFQLYEAPSPGIVGQYTQGEVQPHHTEGIGSPLLHLLLLSQRSRHKMWLQVWFLLCQKNQDSQAIKLWELISVQFVVIVMDVNNVILIYLWITLSLYNGKEFIHIAKSLREGLKLNPLVPWLLNHYCPTLTKGSKWQIIQIWENCVFRLDLAYSTSSPSLEQKHSSCWKILKSRNNDIALMSMYMTDTFCSFTRNVIFKSCFLLSE